MAFIAGAGAAEALFIAFMTFMAGKGGPLAASTSAAARAAGDAAFMAFMAFGMVNNQTCAKTNLRQNIHTTCVKHSGTLGTLRMPEERQNAWNASNSGRPEITCDFWMLRL